MRQARAAEVGPRAPVLPVAVSSIVLAALAWLIGQNDGRMLLAIAVGALLLLAFLSWRGVIGAAGWSQGLRILPEIGIGLFGFMAIAGGMLWAAYFIQTDLQASAMVFGLACLPLAAAGMAASFGTGALLAGTRTRFVFLLAGLAALGLGMAAWRAAVDQSLDLAVLALACAGACYGLANASVTSGIMSAFPAGEAGNASTIATLSKQFGQLIGVTAVAWFRDLSGARPGDDHRLFFLFIGCGLLMMLCTGASAWSHRRQRQRMSASAYRRA